MGASRSASTDRWLAVIRSAQTEYRFSIMPTYEYRCRTCGHLFEHMQSINAEALTNCPPELCAQEDPQKKGTGEVVRKISAGAGLVFKGEGFYLTDYARKGEGKGGSGTSGESGSSKSETKSESTGEAKGGTASESKSETKSESKSESKGSSGSSPSSSGGGPSSPSGDGS